MPCLRTPSSRRGRVNALGPFHQHLKHTKKLPGHTSLCGPGNRHVLVGIPPSPCASCPVWVPAMLPALGRMLFRHPSPSRVWMPPSWWIRASPSALRPCVPPPCGCRGGRLLPGHRDRRRAGRDPSCYVSALERVSALPSWAVPPWAPSWPPPSSVVDSVRPLLSLSLSPVPGPRPGGKVRVVAGTRRSPGPSWAPRSSIPAAASTRRRC